MERDILFIERCIQLLKPGGRLAIVLPHNKVAADSLAFVREWLLRKARVLAVVGLGRNTFLPHTHQKASVLFLQKGASRLAGRLQHLLCRSASGTGRIPRGRILHAMDIPIPIFGIA